MLTAELIRLFFRLLRQTLPHTNSKVRTMQLAPAAAGAALGFDHDRRPFLVQGQALPGAKGRAQAALFAPGPVDVNVVFLMGRRLPGRGRLLRGRGGLWPLWRFLRTHDTYSRSRGSLWVSLQNKHEGKENQIHSLGLFSQHRCPHGLRFILPHQPRSLFKKLFRIFMPSPVRMDSGWNCTPKMLCSRCRSPIISPTEVWADTCRQSGRLSRLTMREW